MNKRIFLVFIVALLFLLTITVLAHSGRTDANGGHWDRSTGTYHFHTGEHAGKGFSSDSSSSEYVPFTPPYEPPTENPYRADNNDTTVNKWYDNVVIKIMQIAIVFISGILLLNIMADFYEKNNKWSNCGCITFAFGIYVVAGLLGEYPKETLFFCSAFGVLLFLCYGVYKLYKKTAHKECIKKYENKVNEYISCIEKYDAKVNEYLIFPRTPIPDDCEIKHGLPANKGVSIGYGDKFTVYQSGNGGKVHTVCGCCSVFSEKHIYNFKRYNDFNSMLCKKCSSNYIPPDMSWYENYLQYTHLLRETSDLYDKRAELKEEVMHQRKSCNKVSIKLILMFDRQSRKCLKDTDKLVRSLQIIQEYRDKQDTKI